MTRLESSRAPAQRQWPLLHRPRSRRLHRGQQDEAYSWRAVPSPDPGQNRALAPGQTMKNRVLLENYFLPGDLDAQIEAFDEHYNHPSATTRASTTYARRCLLRSGISHHQVARKDQATNNRASALATPQARRLNSTPRRGPYSANLRRELCRMF